MPSVAIATVVCETALEYEYVGGLFYVTDPTIAHRKAMRPKEFFQSIARAVECSRNHRPWDRRSAEIISLAEHHAATSK